MGAAAGFGASPFELPWEELARRLKDAAGQAALGTWMTGHHRPRGGVGAWPILPWAGAWGPPWAGRGGGAGRGRAPRGNVRVAILALLWEGARHGYQLMQDIAERSHGAWRPSPGSVYPVLSALQDEGLVDDEKIEGRRVFSLTDSGRSHVAERADELAAVFEDFDAEEPAHEDTRALIASVAGAAIQVLGTGSPAQVEAAQAILAQTRRALYGLLAEGED